MTTSTVADRARALLERKDLEFLPGADALTASSSDGFLAALVEGAYLVAVADGRLSGEEMRTLATTMNTVTGEVLPPGEFSDMMDAFGAALEKEGLPKRLATLGRTVPDEEARREVLGFAALISACDKEVVAAERERLLQIGAAFGLTENAVADVLDTIKRELG